MSSNTIPVKWLQDKNGNEFYPVTHQGAIRDDSGNPIAIPEVLNDLNDVAITSVIGNTQTYFENAVQDYDGNWYDAVILGDQVWMAENLRTTHYADGTAIATYYVPNNDISNLENYGLLYNWSTIMNGASSSNTNPSGIQGIAPNGWHIPSQTEWQQMLTWVGQQSEYTSNNNSTYIAKALASTTGWNTSSTDYAVGNNQSANNATGFNVVPAGFYGANSYQTFGENAFLWSTTGSEYCNGLSITYNAVSVSGNTANPRNYFYSVRGLYNGTVAEFRQAMVSRDMNNQILKHNGTYWVNANLDHDFTFDSETASTSSVTVTFSASQRGTHFIASESDLSVTLSVNNESDNYLWVYNTDSTDAIQVYIQDITHNGSQVSHVWIPEDDIIIQPGYAGEIGIVCNSVGAFITTRCDLKHSLNGGNVT